MLGAEPGFETQSGARTLWLTLGQHCHTRVGLGIRRARGNWAKTASGHSGHQPHPHTPGDCEAGLRVQLDARQCSPMAGLPSSPVCPAPGLRGPRLLQPRSRQTCPGPWLPPISAPWGTGTLRYARPVPLGSLTSPAWCWTLNGSLWASASPPATGEELDRAISEAPLPYSGLLHGQGLRTELRVSQFLDVAP